MKWAWGGGGFTRKKVQRTGVFNVFYTWKRIVQCTVGFVSTFVRCGGNIKELIRPAEVHEHY